MLTLLEELMADPRGILIVFLLALPGRLLALSAHEAAHAWVADRCGDPTARLDGRVTLNPLKHIDPLGFFMMIVVGLGWAKPVPVNPLNYRNYRKDDLKVSVAGVTMNLILFVIGCIVMYLFAILALAQLPVAENLYATSAEMFRTVASGQPVFVSGEYYYSIREMMHYGTGLSDLLIAPVFGQMAGYVYQMLAYFVGTNLMLAAFNLIPLPPLDGYHVLNDLVLKRPLFADRRADVVGNALLYIGLFSGVLDEFLGWIYNGVLVGVGNAVMWLLSVINFL